MTTVVSRTPTSPSPRGRAGARTRSPSGSNRAPARSRPSPPRSPTRSGGRGSRTTAARSASSCITSRAMYPLEIQLAQLLAAGKPITGVTWDDVHAHERGHADGARRASRKEAALDLLRRNSAAAAAAIRALSDEELDRAAPVSLYADAPLTVPVRAGGPRRPPQLSPPRADSRALKQPAGNGEAPQWRRRYDVRYGDAGRIASARSRRGSRRCGRPATSP